VIVASGDGGWTHLGPEVAQFLADRGFRVLGFDSKAYLSSFTAKTGTLSTADVQHDFAALVAHARGEAGERTLLVGVSEGAGLALLAAADDALKPALLGVLALGLPEKAELGWRFRDAMIYLSKGLPDEPLFDIAEFAPRLAPVPLAAIHATQDEFTPVERVKAVFERASEPKRLRVLEAKNHRFSDNQAGLQREILDSIEWIRQQRAQ
jgi:alpha-beta hydrolase superfamily lysophospholipase